MKFPAFLPLFLTAACAALAADSEFKKQQLTDQFWAEGAHFGDFNKAC